MYETVYELSTDQFYFPIHTVVSFVMTIGFAYNGLHRVYKMHESGGGILKKAYHIFWIVLWVAGVIAFAYAGNNTVEYGGSEKSLLAMMYESGEYDYEVVDGVVEDFYDSKKTVWFTVDNMEFVIMRREYRWFGDFKNGDRVRIRFLCFEDEDEEYLDEENIVKVEILRE